MEWKRSCPSLRETDRRIRIVVYEYKPVEDESSIVYLSLEILFQQSLSPEQCPIQYSQVWKQQECMYALTCLIAPQKGQTLLVSYWLDNLVLCRPSKPAGTGINSIGNLKLCCWTIIGIQCKDGIVLISHETIEVNEEREDERRESSASDLKNFLWHNGSVYDAWFYASFVVIGYLSQFFNF
ncbi:hypothetical protein QL285_009371 [Trifolium repens]|nr:hypothetical protein QL285_009371 [Trifolium repens]